ncbi:MAG: selenide, water dikinase SelD [Planctomycetota bacterium]
MALILTKALGMGTLSTAMKKRAIEAELGDLAADQMATLNKAASEAMLEVGVHAATDITGFGLVGHARNIARSSGVQLRFEAAALPIFERAEALAAKGLLSGGACRGQEQLGRSVHVASSVDPIRASLAYDAETSGGLLIAVASERADALVSALEARGVAVRAVVGEVAPAEGEIDVVLS